MAQEVKCVRCGKYIKRDRTDPDAVLFQIIFGDICIDCHEGEQNGTTSDTD